MRKGSIRVLQYMRVLDSGGIEAFIFAIYKTLDKSTIQFDFLVTRDQEEFYDSEIEKNSGKKIILEFKHHSNTYINALRRAKAFYCFCKKNKEAYRIVHFQSIGADGFLDVIAAKLAGIPYRIAHSHIANDYKPSKNNPNRGVGFSRKIYICCRQLIIKHLVSHYSTHYLACSTMAAKWMYTEKAISSEKFRVIKNPISVSRFTYSEQDRILLRKKLELDNKLVIGHVGRFVFSKNHEFLLQVFKNAKIKNPNLVLVLVGDGELLPVIRKEVDSLGLTNDVVFCGEITDVNRIYNAFDLFVFPSVYEGLGIALIEAQANGLPILASDMIPFEARICNNAQYLSLKMGSEKWAEEINTMFETGRSPDNFKTVYESGYDIKDVTDVIERIYIDCYDN